MDASPAPPASVLAYAQTLVGGLTRLCAISLQGAYLHGSAVLGGWVPGRSDIDLLLVAADDIEHGVLDAMACQMLATARTCPGRELEASIVTVAQAGHPAPPWPFLLHLSAGPGKPKPVVRPGSQSPGDRDLLMHYAVCRAAGWPVHGSPPQQLIGAVSRHAVLGYLADEARWAIEHSPESYAVLNACRAMIYLTDQQIVSKISGGEEALKRGLGPADVIERALRQQRGTEPDQPPALDAVNFVEATAVALRSAAKEPAD
jgi:hypothetical protein